MSLRTVDAMLARLHAHPTLIDLGLERLSLLLARLGDPHRRLPPVLHVAGTNGKGSTCAFLRAMAEASGLRVHVYTSPHLIDFNERIRLAGSLVTDAALIDALDRAEAANASAPITVFEILTAAAFLLFSEIAADVLVLEVGLGGRLDATNVVDRPAACAIASLSLDHREFLGDTLAAIAAEKAGILKTGVPVALGAQPPEAEAVIRAQSIRVGAPIVNAMWDDTWPAPSLSGTHQRENAALAAAAIRASRLPVTEGAIARGIATATWPARLQRLDGALSRYLPRGWELWLDGGHNPGAAAALASHLADWSDRPLALLVGMKQTKDPRAFLTPLLSHATIVFAVNEPGQHLALPVAAIVAASEGVARPGPSLRAALSALSTAALPPGRALICGSLHLAGEALRADRA